jgi:peptidyl-prolyl cis-trans isomerase SurA
MKCETSGARKHRRRSLPFLSGILAVALAALLGASARAEIIEQILVKVNGEIFTKTELENRQIQALRQRGQEFDLKDPNDAQLRAALAAITPQLLVDAVDEMLVVQRGRELGYKLTDEQFKNIVENIKKENKIQTEEQWQAALKQENLTIDELRQQLERQMIISRVQQNEVVGKVGVTEEEARAYYDSHSGEFTTPPSVTLREALVAVAGDGRMLNVGADEAAKNKANSIRARAMAGESFETLAADLSDAPSKANAGLIGPISLSDVAPDLRRVIDTMNVGDITPPIRTARGYQILKLESRTQAQTMPFDQARDRISEVLFTDKRKQEFQKYLEKLRAQAIIEWKNADVEKVYKEGLTQQARQAAAAPSF